MTSILDAAMETVVAEDLYTYRAELVRVVDGDTLDLNIDLGFHTHRLERVRLWGVDTPETYGVKKGSDEWKAGMKAKEYVEFMIKAADDMVVDTIKDTKGKYGRYLAIVFLKSQGTWLELNTEMVDAGVARVVSYD